MRFLICFGGAGISDQEYSILSIFLVERTAGIRHSDWYRFKVQKLVNGDALKGRTKTIGVPVYVPDEGWNEIASRAHPYLGPGV